MQRKTANNLPDRLTNTINSYKEEEVVESHGRSHPEGTQNIEENDNSVSMIILI